MGLYEPQILASYDNETYVNGQAMLFTAPRFTSDGKVARPAPMTVFHNGVLVQHDVVFTGPTPHGRFINRPWRVTRNDSTGVRLRC